MFTWICPQCGREVPPAYSECPNCASRSAEAAPAAARQTPVEASRPSSAQPQPREAMPPYTAPRRKGLPTWLLTIVSSLAFIGLGAGVYWAVGYFRSSHATSVSSPNVESPAAKPGAKTNPMQKYIEISGVRFSEDAKKQPVVKFSLTNHSDADVTGLAGNVTIWGRTQRSEEDAVGTFSFSTNIRPQASQELTAPLNTKLKIYELPDWQNVTADLQVTAPQ